MCVYRKIIYVETCWLRILLLSLHCTLCDIVLLLVCNLFSCMPVSFRYSADFWFRLVEPMHCSHHKHTAIYRYISRTINYTYIQVRQPSVWTASHSPTPQHCVWERLPRLTNATPHAGWHVTAMWSHQSTPGSTAMVARDRWWSPTPLPICLWTTTPCRMVSTAV